MADCEYAGSCMYYKPEKCDDLHLGCLGRELRIRLDRQEKMFKMICVFPEFDVRYNVSREIREICETLMVRLRENLGIERAGEMMRDSN